MPTQGDRQNYLWRPNDNSSTTLLRYDLEAEHWARAFKGVAAKSAPTNVGDSFAVIGLVIGLALNLILITILIITDILKFLHGHINKNKILKKEFLNSYPEKTSKIKNILSERPTFFKSKRHDLFEKAALMVIIKQKVSISALIYELNTDFETVCEIIDQLYEAGIISGKRINNNLKVLIEDKVSLDLLLILEKKHS